MSLEDVAVPIALELIRFAADAIERRAKPPEVARGLVGLATKLVPVEELRLYLTETSRAHAEIIADLAEEQKFGSGDD